MVRPQSDIVLVVDDSPDTVRLLTDVLDGAGMTVTFALDGEAALRIAARLRPDIVLMDAIMPRMDGFECCRRLKMLPDFENVPVLFMTGLSEPGDIVRAFAAGGADYVTKPIDLDAMLARMSAHLSNARSIRSARAALDKTEQVLVAVDGAGRVLWFTPRAYRLLQQHFDQGRDGYDLPAAAREWLQNLPPAANRDPVSTRTFVLGAADTALWIVFIDRIERGDILLRIADSAAIDPLASAIAGFALTPREIEVLFWLVKGKTTRDIGTILSLSPRTVEKHLQAIFAKMHVENRNSAIAAVLNVVLR